VLDIGCGSGILSIACLLLGANSAFGVDIDSLAVKTAISNAKENNFEPPKFNAVQGNLSDKVSGKFNLIVANIVADIIIKFNTQVGEFLTDDGVYITGGIIETREDEVIASFYENNFEIIERYENNGWLVFALKKNRQTQKQG
jgi:ribosomal protein L11 methyltransferase